METVVGALDETNCVVKEGDENVLGNDVLDGAGAEVDDEIATATVEDALPVKNGTARAPFEERKAAVKSPTGQAPALHALDLQHPRKGGEVFAQAYQRLPVGHC